ncbi:hypothetical protein F7725_005199 [Dissostichus mawsoni]|uniref:DNA polymerase delta subunit 4 n=1 Tax=Dissostichus mawsoni TaxID=36200 RepID=A0A7J5YQK1_DISMA|nr:hypothetical protein F7725_005199 [Dissostichus mawsoni]
MTTKHGLITDSFKVVTKAKRGARKAKRPLSPPPTHQAEAGAATLQEEEELWTLRHFDLDWRFGPCTGISRLHRWERAELHGLDPPEEIRELLQTHTDPEYSLRWKERHCGNKLVK